MFLVLFAPIIRSSKNCMCNHWYKSQNVVVKFRDEVVVSRWYLALLLALPAIQVPAKSCSFFHICAI
jgi:hypothetical protein